MVSPQTLSLEDRRLLAAWAADCAARVAGLADPAVQASIARTRAFARGELDTAEEIRRRFEGGSAARDAAAKAAGQAAAVCHMGAHALGAAAYAARAGDSLEAQLASMTPEVRSALAGLPLLGVSRSGPLGPGLLTRGDLGAHITALQSALRG